MVEEEVEEEVEVEEVVEEVVEEAVEEVVEEVARHPSITLTHPSIITDVNVVLFVLCGSQWRLIYTKNMRVTLTSKIGFNENRPTISNSKGVSDVNAERNSLLDFVMLT